MLFMLASQCKAEDCIMYDRLTTMFNMSDNFLWHPCSGLYGG
jgi:hypothetical protein